MEIQDFRYERFFELTPDLMCIAGYDGYFKKINPSVAKLLGYSLDELYSRPINDFVFEDDKEITSKVRDELTKSNPLLNFENRYKTRSGEIVWLSWTSLPVEDERLIFAIAKNITHRKILEQERNEMLASLARINNDLKQLTYTTSHDLRSPVNNLLAIFSLIDTSRIHDRETLEVMSILQLAGVKLKQTLDKYIDLLKAKHHPTVELEEIDLHECLANVNQSISSLIQTSKAVFEIDFSEVGSIRFHRAYLDSIFLNLITNAIKYARPGVPPLISIRSKKNGSTNQLVITDNGLGFEMEKVQDQIFGLEQKFHRHSDSKGIGLYLVHNHVTSLGGKIIVESRLHKGTTFTISFRE